MNKLIIMSGIPGAGKTTYANKLKNAYVVSNDEIRFSLTNGVFLNQKDWNALPVDPIQEKLIIEASKKYKTVVLDCTALTNKKRLDYYNKYKNYFNKFELVFMNTNLATCIYQNSLRDRVVPLSKIFEMYQQLEPINSIVKNIFKVKTIKK